MRSRVPHRLLPIFLLCGREAAQKNSIPFEKYSPEEDQRILKLYDGLRLADVTDGLDIAGLQGIGLMNPEIRPLWRDTETFEHRFVGLAVAARYVPTNKRAAKMTPEEFHKWESAWCNELSPEPFVELPRPGSALAIDGGEDGDTGAIGSNNILAWKLKGARGAVVADGDGVVVAPREHAEAVAKAARQILESDKAGRRGLYQKLGMQPDKTVQ